MMKKLLLMVAVLLVGAVTYAQFPSIGIIGDATPGGWDTDVDMATTDGVTYTYEGLTLVAGSVKFRQDDGWANNWGGTGWPSGTGVFNSGNNIPSQPGFYNVTFNRTTLEYNFEDAGNFDDISANWGGGTAIMTTLDGISYYANNVVFEEETTVTFSVNGTEVWGGSGFPEGTATNGGAAITVPANSYNIHYNLETNAYSFDFVIISITGGGVGGWGVDTDMATEDGVNYTVNSVTFALDGDGNSEMKFRLNHEWAVTWGGGTFPSGTMDMGGGNVVVPVGTYSVNFNRMTGDFEFNAPTSATADFSKNNIRVYPNPAQTAWTFNATSNITNLQVIDITGKTVINQAGNAQQLTIDATQVASGIYLAKITSDSGTATVRVVKN
ncbi:T9SS type A sorting domain-containing protein [Flavobacterium rhizosphaerae]|uniref:T9SS type A sorting domain-containing protein n=1 Tax=Flavobacterium rhizosphaerae TaxID=3163298 RepID=A0ABW8YZ72_9FLAO